MQMRSLPVTIGALGAAFAIVFVACASTHHEETVFHGTNVHVGPSGGAGASSDGRLTIVIPPGAVTHDMDLTIGEVTQPPAGSLGTVYEIGPSGTEFAKPVRISLQFDGVMLAGRSSIGARLATFQNGKWVPAISGSVHDGGGTIVVSGSTTHLSYWSVSYPRGCTTSAECETPFQCVDGIGCMMPCHDNADCPRPAYCIEGACVTRACSTDGDCARGGTVVGLRCDTSIKPPPGGPGGDGRGICVDTCGPNRCPTDGFLQGCTIDGTCAVVSCVTDGDCARRAANEIIGPAPTFRCAEGSCIVENAGCKCGDPKCPCAQGDRHRCPPAACDFELNTPCNSNEHCCLDDSNQPACQPLGDNKKEGEPCTRSGECGKGFLCIAADNGLRCRRVCCGHNSLACPAGQACVGRMDRLPGVYYCAPTADLPPAPADSVCGGVRGKAYCCNDLSACNRTYPDPWSIPRYCQQPRPAWTVCGDHEGCYAGCTGCYDPKAERCCSGYQDTWVCPATSECHTEGCWCLRPGQPIENGFVGTNCVPNGE